MEKAAMLITPAASALPATYQGLTFTLARRMLWMGQPARRFALPAGSYNSALSARCGFVRRADKPEFPCYLYGWKYQHVHAARSATGGARKATPGRRLSFHPRHILLSNGTVDAQPVHVYGYTFNLVAGKTAASVKLPSNRQAAFLAIGLGGAPAANADVQPGAWKLQFSPKR